MNQILLGMAFPLAIALFIFLVRRCRIPYPMLYVMPVLMALSVLWAVAPDLPRLVGRVDLYRELARNPWCNVFFWHYTIDDMESDSPLFVMGLVVVIAVILLGVWRELYLLERASDKEPHDG